MSENKSSSWILLLFDWYKLLKPQLTTTKDIFSFLNRLHFMNRLGGCKNGKKLKIMHNEIGRVVNLLRTLTIRISI